MHALFLAQALDVFVEAAGCAEEEESTEIEDQTSLPWPLMSLASATGRSTELVISLRVNAVSTTLMRL